ncbi:MAG: Glutamyl-tRNA(Gln) amidotransferase subunit E [ANME-2 cluster archaeon]|nr:Glutamyl-tRNA(Gln) amidotransferase subunit E [ANME-2 cluster archaeon]
MSSKYDYKKLGLMAGLEIHQQLDTKEKLFCGCPTILRDVEDSNFEFFRYLRPTRSEMGEVDRAAAEEAMLTKQFVYKAYDTTCLVENDEEPPRELNPEALDLTLQIAKLMNMDPFDEVFTMRKIVIDGSNTSGFQRTALVSTNGYIETTQGKVGVGVLCLEEDAAQKVENKVDRVIYSLDRQGIPLVEIGTDPDIVSPGHAREVAGTIGMLLRSTGRVKRGLGTIRQDVNISIARGARVEIKGVQALDLIETIVEQEVERQVNLLDIMEKLQSGNASVPGDIVNVTHLFIQTQSKVIKKALKRGVVLALNLAGFAGQVGREIQPGRRLGTEFSDYAKKSGVGGIFHTDELPAYGITEQEVDTVREAVGAGDQDCVIMVADLDDRAQGALRMVVERARIALEAIPEETRRGLPDGNSAYMRPLPGAARMYPETDVPSVVITRDMLDSIELPELLPERKARYMEELGLNEELAGIVASKHLGLFELIIAEVPGIDPTLVASTLVNTLTKLKRESLRLESELTHEFDIDKVEPHHYVDVFKLFVSGGAAKEVIPDLLIGIAQNPKMDVEDIAKNMGLGQKRIEDIELIVENIINQRIDFVEERGIGAVGPLMGEVMKEFRGSVDGKILSNILKEKIEARLNSIK